jgi:hypothetical protein
MERAAGFAHADAGAGQAKLDKLDATLVRTFTPRHDAALFAELLSLPKDGRYPTLELAPQQIRQKRWRHLLRKWRHYRVPIQ